MLYDKDKLPNKQFPQIQKTRTETVQKCYHSYKVMVRSDFKQKDI